LLREKFYPRNIDPMDPIPADAFFILLSRLVPNVAVVDSYRLQAYFIRKASFHR
jgi:hypothetical protein